MAEVTPPRAGADFAAPTTEVATVVLGMALVGVALLGFLAGLFAFKVKSRWCPACGSWTMRHKPTGETTTVTPQERRQVAAR